MGRTASIIGLVVALVVVSYVAVPAFGAVFDDTERAIEYQQDNPVDVTAELEGTATSVNNTTDEVTLELSNQNSTEVITLTGAGDNATATLPGGDVNVTLDSVSGDTATVTHTFDSQFGWDAGSAALVAVLVIFVLVAVVAMVAGRALDAL